jgi:hypothetical protein
MLASEPDQPLTPIGDRCGVSSKLMQNDALIKGVRHGGWMGDLFGERHRAARILQRAIRVAEKPMGQTVIYPGADAGIVTSIGQGMCPMFCRAIEADAQLCVVTCRGELAKPWEAGPCGVMGLDAKIIIVLLLG